MRYGDDGCIDLFSKRTKAGRVMGQLTGRYPLPSPKEMSARRLQRINADHRRRVLKRFGYPRTASWYDMGYRWTDTGRPDSPNLTGLDEWTVRLAKALNVRFPEENAVEQEVNGQWVIFS